MTESDAPSVLRFRPDLQRPLILLPVSIVFMLVGCHLVTLGRLEGIYLVVLFGISSVLMFLQTLPTCGYLEIDSEGFTVCSQFRVRRFQWDDVREFGLLRVGPFDVIGMNFNPTFQGRDRTSGVLRDMHDFEAGLPNTYGMTGEELLELLTNCKTAGLQPTSSN